MTSEHEELPPVIKEVKEKLPRTGKILGWADKTELSPELSKTLNPDTPARLAKAVYTIGQRAIPSALFLAAFFPIIVRHEVLHDAMPMLIGAAAYTQGTVKEREAEARLNKHAQIVNETILANKNHKAFKGLVDHPEGPTHIVLTGRKVIFLKLPDKYKGKLYLPFLRGARIPTRK